MMKGSGTSGKRVYDLIVYGATGFTGKLLTRYIARQVPASFRWAIAGRSSSRLEAVKKDAGASKADIIIADSSNDQSIFDMVGKTRVVVSTVGPYALYGEPLVAACARLGTSYCDITGETPWVHNMIERYGAEAKKSGAVLVSLCGMDSVPADMGSYFMVREMRKKKLLPTAIMAGVAAKGGVSGGTIASGLNLMETTDESLRKHLMNPFAMIQDAEKAAALAGGAQSAPAEAKGKDTDETEGKGELRSRTGSRSGAGGAAEASTAAADLSDFETVLTRPTDAAMPGWEPALAAYGAPFIMAPVNCRVVLRSAALAAGQGAAHRYSPAGTPFDYQERFQTSSLVTALSVAGGTAAAVLGLAMPCTRCCLKRYLPKSGDGPDNETMRTGFLCYTYAATPAAMPAAKGGSAAAAAPERVFATLTANGDPGYFLTAQMLGQCALSLAQDGDKIPGRAVHGGGYLTPATAFGDVLVDRLTEHVGFRFTYHGEERPSKFRSVPADMGLLGLDKEAEEEGKEGEGKAAAGGGGGAAGAASKSD